MTDSPNHTASDNRHDVDASSLKVAIDAVAVSVLLLAPQDLRIIYANKTAQTAFLIRTEQRSFFDDVCDDDITSLETWLRGETNETSIVVRVRPFPSTINTIFRLSRSPNHIVAVAESSIELSSPPDDLLFKDPLTGLRNRRSLDQTLRAAIQLRRRQWGLLFLDLNRYKEVNDRFGHLAGDQVLVEFSERLTASARPKDQIFRFGGDEFLMFVDEIENADSLEGIADRIMKEVWVEIGHSTSNPIRVDASVGSQFAWDELETPEQIINAADRNMYLAKANRSNRKKEKPHQY